MKILFFAVVLVCSCVLVLCDEKEEGLRLISFSETHSQWMTQSEVDKIVGKIKFMDITEFPVAPRGGPVIAADPFPQEPEQKILVSTLLPLISSSTLQTNLNTLTTFNTRYYTSTTGVDAAQWISRTFTEYATGRDDITVELYKHTWAQPSVIATIPGRGPNKDQVVIIGGHEDSVGSTSTGRSPGADDDGTGTVTVLEIFRVLVAGGFHPDRTLRFITYAGEEAGLLGSQAIANDYKAKAIPVHAALQLDMTGYGGDTNDIAIIGDYVDVNLTDFVKLLVDAYSVLDWTDDRCGYACSDHASWYRAGYRSSFPFEAVNSNPYIHSANDVVSRLSFTRIVEFAKIGVAFAVELALPTISP